MVGYLARPRFRGGLTGLDVAPVGEASGHYENLMPRRLLISRGAGHIHTEKLVKRRASREFASIGIELSSYRDRAARLVRARERTGAAASSST